MTVGSFGVIGRKYVEISVMALLGVVAAQGKVPSDYRDGIADT